MRITFVQASGLEQTVEATDGDNLMTAPVQAVEPVAEQRPQA